MKAAAPLIPSRHLTRFWIVLAGALTGGCRACPPDPGDVIVTARDQIEQECPMDSEYYRYGGVLDSQLVLPGRLTAIPEFHDCQRFIRTQTAMFGSWQEYGSLYAIWVRDSLEHVTFPLTVGGSIPGNADSVAFRDSVGGTLYASGGMVYLVSGEPTAAVAVPVVLVYSDKEAYPPLGIDSGFNCLYLYSPPQWQAKMVPVSGQKDCSRENIDPALVQGTSLQVRETKASGRSNADYPPVARWDVDAYGKYFIGIKCLAAWCEVGTDFGASPDYHGDRTREIKGWYDEQYLSVRTANYPSWPTPIRGTVFPDPLLDRYTQGGFPINTYVTVATTALHVGSGNGPPSSQQFGVYKTKFNFDAGSPMELMNEIAFCRGTRETCVPEEWRDSLPCSPRDTLWAKVTSAETKSVVYRCITYTNHGVTLPGVVRWRWLANDEKNWVSCPSGCCQVDP